MRGTRKGVLQEIECWVTGELEQRIFWLNGLAGTGKSTIAQTFAEKMFANGRLGPASSAHETLQIGTTFRLSS